MERLYYICDVFTDKRFGGNQLAVLPDARGLDDRQMQQIAREFNFSETTFVFPPEAGHTRKVRIFTPLRELAFAGHPNIGTAFVLAMTDPDLHDLQRFVFEEKAGPVEISLNRVDNGVFCELQSPQALLIGDVVPTNLVAQALGIPPGFVLTSRHQPRVCSVGMPVLLAELADEEILASIKTEPGAFRRLEKNYMSSLLHVYTDLGNNHFNTRMFAPQLGIQEDPATGGANVALSGLLAACDDKPDGAYSYTFTQGVSMGRPSRLKGRARKQNTDIIDTWIGGHSVMVSQGTLFLEKE